MQVSCRSDAGKATLSILPRTALAVLTAAVVLLVSIAMFSAWHRHDKVTGSCNFNHLDGLQAESQTVLNLGVPYAHSIPAARPCSHARVEQGNAAHSPPRAPPAMALLLSVA